MYFELTCYLIAKIGGHSPHIGVDEGNLSPGKTVLPFTTIDITLQSLESVVYFLKPKYSSYCQLKNDIMESRDV